MYARTVAQEHGPTGITSMIRRFPPRISQSIVEGGLLSPSESPSSPEMILRIILKTKMIMKMRIVIKIKLILRIIINKFVSKNHAKKYLT